MPEVDWYQKALDEQAQDAQERTARDEQRRAQGIDRESLVQRANLLVRQFEVARQDFKAQEAIIKTQLTEVAQAARQLEGSDPVAVWAHLYWHCPDARAVDIAAAADHRVDQLLERVRPFAPMLDCRCGTPSGIRPTSRAHQDLLRNRTPPTCPICKRSEPTAADRERHRSEQCEQERKCRIARAFEASRGLCVACHDVATTVFEFQRLDGSDVDCVATCADCREPLRQNHAKLDAQYGQVISAAFDWPTLATQTPASDQPHSA